MFLLVPAYPGCPGSKAVKRSLLLLLYVFCIISCVIVCFIFVHAAFVHIKLMMMMIGDLFQHRMGVSTVNFHRISYRIFRLGCDNKVADFIAPFMKNLVSKLKCK